MGMAPGSSQMKILTWEWPWAPAKKILTWDLGPAPATQKSLHGNGQRASSPYMGILGWAEAQIPKKNPYMGILG